VMITRSPRRARSSNSDSLALASMVLTVRGMVCLSNPTSEPRSLLVSPLNRASLDFFSRSPLDRRAYRRCSRMTIAH
jgi:hypothetical protein